MCAKCDEYADQREASNGVPKYQPSELTPVNSRRCAGCGERIQYLDMCRYDGDNDEWWHEGCETQPDEEPREPGDGYCSCGERLDVQHHHGDV